MTIDIDTRVRELLNTGLSPAAAAAITASEVAQESGGSGGVASVTISTEDPGAVGAGSLWLNTAQDAYDDLSNFPLFVRNEADDGWSAVVGDAVGPVSLSSYSPDGDHSALVQLHAGDTGTTMNLSMFGADGNSGVFFTDVDGDAALAQIKVGGQVQMTIEHALSVGLIKFPNLPTYDPNSPGALWNNNGGVQIGPASGPRLIGPFTVAFDTAGLVWTVAGIDGVELTDELPAGTVVDAWIVNRTAWAGTSNPSYSLVVGVGGSQPYSDDMYEAVNGTLLDDGIGSGTQARGLVAATPQPLGQTRSRAVIQSPSALRAILYVNVGDAPTAGEADIYAFIIPPAS